MTWLDEFIQTWRIRKAAPYIKPTDRVLDIGTADGALFRVLSWIKDGVGIDPDLTPQSLRNAELVKGFFPEALPPGKPFNVIVMLAVLEHIPGAAQRVLASNCFEYLEPKGRLVITVPSPATDHVITVLKAFRLADGMATEQHYGYDINETPAIFGSAGFRLLKRQSFQLGFNNLFVFERP